MYSSLFFKLFPPPKFLLMPRTGIDISDDAIRFVAYSRPIGERFITKYGIVPLEPGIVEGGDIKDEARLVSILSDMAKAHGISFAKLSIPEEKAYLFETDVPPGDRRTISQHIEFKLEENIPLTAQDAVFAFDVIAGNHGRGWTASVSAVPRSYIEHMMDVFHRAGITPLSFETVPRAIARVVSTEDVSGDILVIHAMRRKTGIYVISQQAVGFTSTISGGIDDIGASVSYTDTLASEIGRVSAYWKTKNGTDAPGLKQAIIVGQGADELASLVRPKVSDIVPVDIIDVWRIVLNTHRYVPPILKSESFEYAPAAGLAI
jgi:Tfp pilus assembly PilM family ATPase